MIYAQIKNGFIRNTIILDDVELEPLFLIGFDYLIDVTDTWPFSPGIGWTYDADTQTFARPEDDNG